MDALSITTLGTEMKPYEKVTLYRYRLELQQVVIDREEFETINQNLKALKTENYEDYWSGYHAFNNLPWQEFSWGYNYNGSVVPDGYGQVAFAGDMDMYSPWLVDLEEGADPPWVESLDELQVNDARQSKVVLDKQEEYRQQELEQQREEAIATGSYPAWFTTPNVERDFLIDGQIVHVKPAPKSDD